MKKAQAKYPRFYDLGKKYDPRIYRVDSKGEHPRWFCFLQWIRSIDFLTEKALAKKARRVTVRTAKKHEAGV